MQDRIEKYLPNGEILVYGKNSNEPYLRLEGRGGNIEIQGRYGTTGEFLDMFRVINTGAEYRHVWRTLDPVTSRDDFVRAFETLKDIFNR